MRATSAAPDQTPLGVDALQHGHQKLQLGVLEPCRGRQRVRQQTHGPGIVPAVRSPGARLDGRAAEQRRHRGHRVDQQRVRREPRQTPTA